LPRSKSVDGDQCGALFQSNNGCASIVFLWAYLAQRYKRTRAKDAVGNVEFYDLDDDILRQFDGKFLYHDQVRIAFRHSDDWSEITKFFAGLGNLSG